MNQSWLGVITAANTAMNRIACFRQLRSLLLSRTPTNTSDISTNGNSKETPNARINSVMNPMYLSIDSTANSRVVPANPSKKFSALGSV